MSEIDPAEMARTLRGIQELDTRIIGLQREIEELEEKHLLDDIRAQLESAEQTLADAEAELTELEHRQHKLDGEVDLLSQKIEKEESRMMSGTIMNPKELSSIQAEIFSLRKKRDEMETEDLEEMEGIDGLRDKIRTSSGLIEQVTERQRRAREAYAADLAEKQHQVAGLESERDEQKVLLDPETVNAYEKLLEQKDGLAVVGIVQGRSCGGCRIEFSRTQIDRFQHEEGVFRCEYCRRMLVK